MMSRNFTKLSNEEIAGFIMENEGPSEMNINVSKAVESSTDLWILANMNGSI